MMRTAIERPPATLPARLLMWLAVAALVVAHGCHAGDHDDEPAFVPRVSIATTLHK